MSNTTRRWLSWLPLLCSLAACVMLFRHAYVETKQHQRADCRAAAYFTLLYDSGVAVVLLEPGGKIVEWNPGAEQMFGYTFDEVKGMLPSFLMLEDTWQRHCLALMNSQASLDKSHIIAAGVIAKSGDIVPTRAIVRSIRNGHGFYHLAIFIRDSDVIEHERQEPPDHMRDPIRPHGLSISDGVLVHAE